jgi:hypothetical protein
MYLSIISRMLLDPTARSVETVYKARTETDVYESSAVPKSTGTNVSHAT